MDKFQLKTEAEIVVMAEGGAKLALVRDALANFVKPGMTTMDIEKEAMRLIKEQGGKASFAMVPGYKYATCINVNDEVVHAVPNERIIKSGDIVGIDVGIFYKGFHTDTAVTVLVPTKGGKIDHKVEKFLEVGKTGLKKAISEAKPGKRIADISKAMQSTVENAGYSVVQALTGHGVGRNLHEEPAIPCFVLGSYENSPKIVPGMVLAIEIMYNMGESDVMYKNSDGWTINTADGTISGLFEETVAVTKDGPVVLTQAKKR